MSTINSDSESLISNSINFDFSDGNAILSDIFKNKSTVVNSLLPFGLHIKGNILICYERCGQSFSNTEIDINIMKNYGKMLMIKPINDNSELTVFHDSRNENIDEEGNGKYKLKYICFTCPPTIKIGENDADMQSYLIYSNNKGLYAIVCTLYVGSTSDIDSLPNALLNSLLTSNNIPEITKSNGNINIKNIDINHFFPQDKKDYYEYINSDSKNNKRDVLVKVFQKKVRISTNIIETLKQKLFNPKSNDNYSNFSNSMASLYKIPTKHINIFHIPQIDMKIPKQNDTFKNEDKVSIEEETVEEENSSLIDKLKKSSLEEKKEKYINFADDDKIYKIDINDGSIKKDDKKDDIVYDNLTDLLLKNKSYSEDEIKKAINEFPNYIYQDSYWRLKYKVRLYETSDDGDYSIIDDIESIDDVKNKINKEETNKNIFYSMKNFPNYGIGDDQKYYVTYYYPEKVSELNNSGNMIYLFSCWIIILFNYIFYKLIVSCVNEDYGDITVDDSEIINNDDYKKLAAWRLLINIIFIIQIITTLIYSVLNISGLINSSFVFSGFYIFLLLLIFITIILYACARLYFSDRKVSYSESKSLKILLESNNNDENNNILNWIINSFSLIKNSLISPFVSSLTNLAMSSIIDDNNETMAGGANSSIITSFKSSINSENNENVIFPTVDGTSFFPDGHSSSNNNNNNNTTDDDSVWIKNLKNCISRDNNKNLWLLTGFLFMYGYIYNIISKYEVYGITIMTGLYYAIIWGLLMLYTGSKIKGIIVSILYLSIIFTTDFNKNNTLYIIIQILGISYIIYELYNKYKDRNKGKSFGVTVISKSILLLTVIGILSSIPYMVASKDRWYLYRWWLIVFIPIIILIAKYIISNFISFDVDIGNDIINNTLNNSSSMTNVNSNENVPLLIPTVNSDENSNGNIPFQIPIVDLAGGSKKKINSSSNLTKSKKSKLKKELYNILNESNNETILETIREIMNK